MADGVHRETRPGARPAAVTWRAGEAPKLGPVLLAFVDEERAAPSTPERLERAVEDGQVVVPMDQQRSARVIDVVAVAEVDVSKRFGDVEHAPHVHVESEAPQKAAEDEEVAQESARASTGSQT